MSSIATDEGVRMGATWVILAAALCGGLGGFAARVLPGGLGKVDLSNAPAEAGAVASSFAGALAGVLSLLDRHDVRQLVFVGDTADLHALAFTGADAVAAVFIGFGGLKWLSAHQDNRTLRSALGVAATGTPDPELAAMTSSAKPRNLLQRARR